MGGVLLLPVKQQDGILGQEPSPSFESEGLEPDRQQEACRERDLVVSHPMSAVETRE